MKGLVIFTILLIISMPVSFAKEVVIPEMFETLNSIEFGKEVYYYAGSKLIASVDENLEYKYQDRLGSDFESKSLPFGQPIAEGYRFSFTGKEMDMELHYFSARYYNSELGRFTSTDPIRDNHAYSYVANNPMNYVDPTGMMNVNLRSNEYVVPSTVLKAMYAVTMGVDFDSPRNTPGGLSVSKNFMPGKFLDSTFLFSSKKEKFYDIMGEKLSFSNDQIDNYYDILTTSGNIALKQDYPEYALFHERGHHFISNLPVEKQQILYEASKSFISEISNEIIGYEDFLFEGEIEKAPISYFEENFGVATMMALSFGSWQEIYTYMAQFKEYPGSKGRQMQISPGAYTRFEQSYPEAYSLYNEMIDSASE
jgi:RHS repeat-associated protein